AARQADADQAVLAVVAVFGDEGLYGQPRILPLALLIIFRTLLLVVDRGDVAVVIAGWLKTSRNRPRCLPCRTFR
ncbi:hypothetical protein, partial [Pseudomonas syringae]|uniref:hypothetical protein n=1 Tax=Pseudomonas syringae TaxID=317 RepID=UPI000BD4D09E